MERKKNKKIDGKGKAKIEVDVNYDKEKKDEAIVSVEVRYVARVPRSELAEWKKNIRNWS